MKQTLAYFHKDHSTVTKEQLQVIVDYLNKSIDLEYLNCSILETDSSFTILTLNELVSLKDCMFTADRITGFSVACEHFNKG